MTDLYELAQKTYEDADVSFEILPADARLSVSGQAAALSYLFERASSVVPNKPSVPGTEWVQLDAELGVGTLPAVRISATDGEVSLTVETDALDIGREGSVLLPGKKIHDILKLVPESRVDLTVLGSAATITSGRARWTVATPPGEAIPPRPDISGLTLHPVPRDELLRALTIVRLAVNQNNARDALRQALIRKQKITGSDAGRLHRVLVPELPDDIDTTLPARFVDELVRALRDTKEPVVHFGAGDLFNAANIGRDTLISQRYLLGYPDVESILLSPSMDNVEHFSVDTLHLIEVIRRVKVNSDPDQQSISMDIAPGAASGSWNLIVWARDRHGNQAKEVVPTVWVGGKKPRSFTVDAKNLIELLAASREPHVEIRTGPDTKTRRYPLLVEASRFTGILQQRQVL